MASKPNLLSFSVAVGVFENKTVREFRDMLDQKFKTQVPFSRLAILFFEMVLSHAAANQVDGDYSTYTDDMFYEQVFAPKFIALGLPSPSREEISEIVNMLKVTFLDEDGCVRGWADYQPHLLKHVKKIRARRKGGEASGVARDKIHLNNLKKMAKKGSDATQAEPLTPRGKKLKSEPPEKIEWDGKLWFPPDLRKAVSDLEAEVAKKEAKLKKTDPGDESHNIWFSQLLEADKQLASAKSALLRTKIDPPARRKPQPARPAPAKRGDPDAAAKAFEDFKRTKEEIAAA